MKRILKTVGAVVSAGALLIMVALASQPPKDENLVKTVTYNGNITIEARPSAYESLLIAPYKTVDTFISEEQSPGFIFTSVGGAWEEEIPNGTYAEGFIRFKVEGKWSAWLNLEAEEDLIEADKKYAMASSNPAQSMQYKFHLYGDGISKPVIKNPQWTFIKTAETKDLGPMPVPQFSSIKPISDSTYLALTGSASTLGIISRSSWGADESYRYMSDNNLDPVLVEVSDDYYQKFKDELQYSRVVEKDSSGDKYKWPLQYPTNVKKFIIHHTATTGNLTNPKQAIRDIYYYHSVTRAWGDIGYNYIVDGQGKIYEGRYGGDGVIGAHAGPGNNGSIGIAVLGNYEENEVPEKVISSLGNLIGEKARLHGIQPDAKSIFRGENIENVFAHKDIMSTTCPGIYLYEKLPTIRIIAAQWEKKQKPKFVKDYDYQDTSNTYYLEVKPDETKTVTLTVENIGNKTWDNKTFIVVDTNPDFEGLVTFPGSDPVILATMQESQAKPGDTATFTFKIKGSKKSDMAYMSIAPVFSGIKKAKDYIVLPVAVQQTDFKYKFIDAKYPSETMEKDEKTQAWVKLKNVGNITWRKGGENTIYLKADHEQERISEFSLPRSTKMGFLTEDEVAPGETGTFTFDIKAPSDSGHYREYFTPYIDGVGWLQDIGMNFETTVFGGLYEAEVIDKVGTTKWRRGQKYAIRIKLRNLGRETWTQENLKLMVLKETDLKISDAKLITTKVKPGDTGTISFVAKVADDEVLERKSVLIRPMVNGNHLLKNPIYFYYRVTMNNENLVDQLLNRGKTSQSPTTTTTTKQDEGDIRVKLSSFTGEPEITANGSFEIYNDKELIGTLSSGDIAKVSKSGSNYKVTFSGTTYTKTGPIRFVPKNAAIIRIDNFNHAPGWNADLNDNEYRGTLEVRIEESKLIVINELPLEDYLKGLGEVSNNEKTEKIKAIMVAARSYAKYYMTKDEKFPGMPYDLDDDPAVSQKYLGYGLEKRSPNVAAGVTATKGEVITYGGEVVKAPYFNQSDGVKTKSAKEVWGWTTTPYLVGVDDSFCDGDSFLGHGVGLSGCGAKGMAEKGYTYDQILKHYYTNVEIDDL